MSSKKDKSNKKEGGLNRRAMIAAAAAAGAALPLVTVSAKAQGRGTRVVVDLGGVELPREVATQMESDIRRAVLMAVARAQPKTKFMNTPLQPGTYGIWLAVAKLNDGGMTPNH